MSLPKRHPKHEAGLKQGDGAAVARYEYLLAIAQPDMIDKMHVEAFGRLSSEQLRVIFTRFVENATTVADRPIDAEPTTLARFATDVEVARPGSLLRILGPQARDAEGERTLLATIAEVIVASPLAAVLFPYRYGNNSGLSSELQEDELGY